MIVYVLLVMCIDLMAWELSKRASLVSWDGLLVWKAVQIWSSQFESERWNSMVQLYLLTRTQMCDHHLIGSMMLAAIPILSVSRIVEVLNSCKVHQRQVRQFLSCLRGPRVLFLRQTEGHWSWWTTIRWKHRRKKQWAYDLQLELFRIQKVVSMALET